MSSFITTVPEDWASLSTPNPEFMRLLEGFPAGAQLVTAETTIASLRALGQQAPVAEKWAGVAEDNISVLMRDGYENRVRRYISEDGGEPAGPLLIMIHGGGFCVGRLEQVEEECRKWVQRHKGVAFSLDHRFAPEHKFPVPIEDCYDSIKWVCLLIWLTLESELTVADCK
jgi:acetyl esterase